MPGTKHFIVATAGHVDHGKSALVQALTGIDPDRLPEEKARGITIDLGFAVLDLVAPSGTRLQVGIVDVPGHEDFVKNMVAGVGAADLALLVVAADDGWMPQTEEHLQVLTYFGVRRAVVALSKIDLTSDAEHAADAVRQRLSGTPFAAAPIIPTSVADRRSIAALEAAIGGILADASVARDIGKPRLPIDRVFTLPGIGTVVTGTLLDGDFHQGEQVIVQPSGNPTWIRRIQSHNRDVESSGPGRRTALNLPNLTADEVRRGDVVTLAAHGGPASTLDVILEISPRAWRTLRTGARVRVHYGSGNVGAYVTLLKEGELNAGDRALAQLRLDRPVFVFAGDRFTIRDWAEQSTLAGGLVLDADADPRASRNAARMRYLTGRAEAPDDVAAWVTSLLERDTLVPLDRLLVKSRFSQAEVDASVQCLVASGVAAPAGDAVCLAATWATLRQRLIEAIDAYHRSHPERPGMPLTEVRLQLDVLGATGTAFDALLEHASDHGVVKDGAVVRRTTHRPALPPALQAAGSMVRATLAAHPFDPPSRRVLAPDETSRRALRFLLEIGEAIEIGAELVLAAENVTRARETVVAVIGDGGPATLGDVRARLPCSRRVLLPLLEYFDRAGVTVRNGDRRTLRG